MTIYFDENLPCHLAEGYHQLQYPEGLKTGIMVEVKYLPNEFGNGVKDIDWIPEIGKRNGCVITQDININRQKHELELYRKHKVGMFFLRGPSKKQGMSIWQMVEVLARNWPDIIDRMQNEQRPFAYEVKAKGKLKKL